MKDMTIREIVALEILKELVRAKHDERKEMVRIAFAFADQFFEESMARRKQSVNEKYMQKV